MHVHVYTVPTIIKVHKEELQTAANSFQMIIGRGTVYRGQLKQEQVAIKVLYWYIYDI